MHMCVITKRVVQLTFSVVLQGLIKGFSVQNIFLSGLLSTGLSLGHAS